MDRIIGATALGGCTAQSRDGGIDPITLKPQYVNDAGCIHRYGL